MRIPLHAWPWLGLLVVSAAMLIHVAYFVLLPKLVAKWQKRKSPDAYRRYLEGVVASPSFLGPQMKVPARLMLVGAYMRTSRHEQAEAHCRAILANSLPPALEADVRRRLADCLEALGRHEESAEQRKRASARLDAAADDPLRFLTKGTLLERQNRFPEAYAMFEQGLALVPESNRAVQVEFMMHLLLSAFNSGRPADTLVWAELVIADGSNEAHVASARRMAGVACKNMGRLEEAEVHLQAAYDLAAAQGNPDELGKSLALLASSQLRRGRLAEAYATCQKAAPLGPGAIRHALATESAILWAWGRYEEALDVLRRYVECQPLSIPQMERRSVAAAAIDAATIECELGRGDAAWTRLQVALAELATDAKLGLRCHSISAWVDALRGRLDQSRETAAQVETRLEIVEQDRMGRLIVYSNLGRAALVWRDYSEAERYWRSYADQGPDPVYVPKAHFFLGESLLGLGDRDGARAEFRKATATGLDTEPARLARRRLSQVLLGPI